tara:strand:+ start:126 stop:719 length:594 start_codon:yes stop_codon:yes gene_type:complete
MSNSLIRSAECKELYKYYRNLSSYGNIISGFNQIKEETKKLFDNMNNLIENNKQYLEGGIRRNRNYLFDYLQDINDIILSLKTNQNQNRELNNEEKEEIKKEYLESLIEDEEIKQLLIQKGKYREIEKEECQVCMLEYELENNKWKECHSCNNKICNNCYGSLQLSNISYNHANMEWVRAKKCIICREPNTYQNKTY